MRRARALIFAMNALRRQEEEMERRPGINPGRGRGVDARLRNWERVLGRENASVFMGRSRSFPAPPQANIRKQPHTQPCCLTLGFRSQGQPMAPTPHFLQMPFPCPTQTLLCPVHVKIIAHATNYHHPHPLPRMIRRALHQSFLPLMNLFPHKPSYITFFILFIYLFYYMDFLFLSYLIVPSINHIA